MVSTLTFIYEGHEFESWPSQHFFLFFPPKMISFVQRIIFEQISYSEFFLAQISKGHFSMLWLYDYNSGRVYWTASGAPLQQRAPLSKQKATITWPPCSIFQNQGKTAVLPVLPPMAPLSITQIFLN